MLHFKNIPIKFRLAIQFTLFITAIVGTFSASVYYFYIQNSASNINGIVKLEYENITNSIDILNYTDEGVELREETLEKIEKATNLGLLIFVFDSSGTTVISPTSIDTQIPKDKIGYFKTTIANHSYQFYAGKYKNLLIVVGMNDHVFLQNVQILRNTLFIIWMISSLLSFVVGYIFSASALRPIHQLIGKVKSIDILNEDTPTLRSQQNADEIGMLASAFDRFIQKIREIFHREKEFSRDISHELRTPLMVIESSLELIDNDSLSPYQKEKITMIQESTKKMEHLINELLFLERDMEKEDFTEIDIVSFFDKFLESYRNIAERKGLKLLLEIKNPLSVKTSFFLLERVFGNLIGNAIFYTKQGEVKITIQKNSVVISDTGVGIGKEELENIWKRFYRIEKSRSQEGGGFGLGLSIVKKITDAQNWKITVTSKINTGTTFTITF